MTSTLSHWGWGYADRFPDVEARGALGQQVAMVLGLPESPLPEEPVPLDAVRLRAPRLPVPERLAAFTTDAAEARVRHTYGRAYPDLVRGLRGDFGPAPDLVALPRDEDDVAATLAWASAQGVAVIPYGGGTSVVGGVEPDVGDAYAGTLSLDLRRLDRLLAVDAASLSAHLEAGATGPRIEAQLAEHGLTLRHFPQSFEHATLGGFVATRSGGHFATLYTHIDELVQAVRMITPTGPWESRRLPGSGAGPSPDRLVCGSEGILGVITSAWMRVRPRPRWRSSADVTFEDWDAAVAATRAVAQAGLYPSNCRLLDKREAMLHGVRLDGRHVLLLGFESADHPTEAAMARALAVAGAHGGACEGARHRDEGARAGAEGDAGAWRQAFLQGPYLQTILVSLGVLVDTFETACTWEAFPRLHAGVVGAVKEALREATGHRGMVSCRFTHVYPDGPAPYYTFAAPVARGGELEAWTAVKRAASDALLAHGATITHHHAVGRTHRPWYAAQRPRGMGEVLAAAKAALDPAGILNPGVLLAPDEVRRR